MKITKWISGILASVLLFGCMSSGMPVRAAETDTQSAEEPVQTLLAEAYSTYLAEHGQPTAENTPSRSIEIPAAGYESMDADAYPTEYRGKTALYWEQEGGSVTWKFRAEEEGYYQLTLNYCPISGKNNNIVVTVSLDGEVPFSGTQNVNLHRTFLDETYFGMDDNAFHQNMVGDDLRPAMVEQFDWKRETLMSSRGDSAQPVYFYLTKGEHTVTVELNEECFALESLVFGNAPALQSYAEVSAQWAGKATRGYMAAYEAEKSYLKNAVTLFATYDTAYAHVTPSSAKSVYYNTIGKNTWKELGQQITWEFEVPEDGTYCLAFKVKQNTKTNAFSGREISIDGQVLCAEMSCQKFGYASSWYVQPMADDSGKPMEIYLTAGRHVLGMTAALDTDFAQVLQGVSDVNSQLQGWYREIIRITGFNADSSRVTVDLNRDFDLEGNIPGLLEGLAACKAQLDEYYAEIGRIDGISTSSASILKEMSTLLEGMLKHPKRIAKRMETFRSDISTMATWVIDMQEQPLTMDKFYVYSPDQKAPGTGSNVFSQMWYRLKLFLNSFSGSSTSVAGSADVGETDKTIRVWISTADITTTGASSGRDQAIILKKLIDESFTSQTGIQVDVSLVSGSDTLVQAVLAGEGPDAALFSDVSTPVNLAMRGALLDLSQFEGYEEVLTEFTESAVTPFRYKGGLYAFPETQSFNMIFYRTDIYQELGLEPPKTWEEFYEQVVTLMNHSYMVGVPQNQNIFETFLYQSGTSFYTEDLTRSTFDTAEALTAFEDWTGLYTKYSLSLIFDFFNRFRSGEMAMGIMPYNQVNYLYSAAPELDGLWGMACVPGKTQPDGSVNFVETSTATGCIGLKDTKYPQETYEFLKWWVSSETQARFGVEVEQTLGIAARYGTANTVAFEALPWNYQQAEVLRKQRENTVAVEEIPGNYYIARNLSFAFRAVVYSNKNLRDTLYEYNIEINKELARKQEEFSY